MSKKKRTDSYLRKVGGRGEPRPRFLIICEGEQTEPNYFRSFPTRPRAIVTVNGFGKSPQKLVEIANQKKEELEFEDEKDQVWCVFDRDEWEIDEFNGAIKKAKDNGILVAFSNEAFELWFILHFELHTTGSSRGDYQRKLTKFLGSQYKKNSQNMYTLLFSKQLDALNNANKLYSRYKPNNPASDNPSTSVHFLVEELNKYL